MLMETVSFVQSVFPNRDERIILSIFGTIGGVLSWAVGGFDMSIKWLLIFVVIDYITGISAAYKRGEISSKVGFSGIFKKVFIFSVVSLCHGLDIVAQADVMRNAAILAYSVNEAASILENIDRLGFGSCIPPFLRRGLKMMKYMEEKKFDNNPEEKNMY